MKPERRSYWSGWTRAAYSGAALGLMLLLSGDRARMAVATGIDPLDILKVQVRPNILFVLDSSSSMSETFNGARLSEDDSRSKMVTAKAVIKSAVDDFEDRANFALVHYAQGNLALDESTRNSDGLGSGAKARFLYTTTSSGAARIGISVDAGTRDITLFDEKLLRLPCTPVGSGAPTAASPVCNDDIMDSDGTVVYRLYAGGLYNGEVVQYVTDASTNPSSPTFKSCGVTSDLGTFNPPQVTLEEVDSCGGSATGPQETFVFQGVAGDWGNDVASCNAPSATDANRFSQCTDIDQVSDVAPFLNPALKVSGGAISGYSDDGSPDFNILTKPNPNGIQAGGYRPIWPTLKWLKTNLFTAGYFSALTIPKPRSFIVYLTDGDDQCNDPSSPDTTDTTDFTDPALPANDRALRAAYRAELLHTAVPANDPATSVNTWVIGIGSGVHAQRLDWISYGGTGLQISTVGSSDAQRWATIPTAAQINACVSCQVSQLAGDATSLELAVNTAINRSLNNGEFSSSPSVIATIFELTTDSSSTPSLVESPLDPTTRYNQRVNILYQSTFELPDWEGHLFAFRNDGSFQGVSFSDAACTHSFYDAGRTLNCKVTERMKNTNLGNGADLFTFAQLHGGALPRTIGASSAVIKRRIFTSNGNGAFVRTASGSLHTVAEFDSSQTAGSNVVALWPPNQTGLSSGITDIDPAAGTAGPLDAAMGISTMTFSQLQAFTAACEGSTDSTSGPIPSGCTTAGLETQTALKEARQIILAYIAGAQVSRGTDGLPLRTSSSALLYSSAGWLLRDTQNSAPAIATPPLRFTPSTHISEFTLYRDGRRNENGQGINEINLGFGLRNPDFDDSAPTTKLDLKPVMTVIYHATNFLLHAFRAGPQCSGGCPGTGEQGSEELWAYLPYDLLPKALTYINQGQVTDPHVYGMAASVRVASIFVPDPDGFVVNGAPFTGRWRSVIYFGRGAGGKYYTAIDVTAPGPFTIDALEANPPWVMWSRGNIDTVDGTSGGTANHNVSDKAAYNDLGDTWSVPALGNIDPATGACTNSRIYDATNAPVEWRVFFGAGYGDNATNQSQGKRFFNVDAVTGDICQTVRLGDGTTTYIANNALPAAPAAYNSRAQDPPGSTTHFASDKVTRVYIPDVHGRVWRYSNTSAGILHNAGPTQPFGDAVALLKINQQPVVLAESGDDSRVPLAAGPFRMFALPDLGADTDTASATSPAAAPLLPSPVPSPIPSPAPSPPAPWTQTFLTGFRGNVQPTTAFNSVGNPRVFFAGIRYNAGVIGSSCSATFDTIIYGLTALSGGAVYDFTGDTSADAYTIITGTRTTGIQVVGGALFVGDSGALASAPTPTPDPFPTATPGPPAPAYVTASNLKTNSPVCR